MVTHTRSRWRYALAVLFAALPMLGHGWMIVSRELVDVEYGADDTLSVLVSAPSSTIPGLYHWNASVELPKRICRIHAPSFFSFDRKTIIERVRGATSWLRVYHASTCRVLARIKVDGYVLDADVRGGQIVAAVRDAERNYELHLYSRRGKQLASTAIGRNIEMGFAPDGRSVVNFDLSDAGARIWTLPRLARTDLPAWARVGELTFVPGASFAKHYSDGKLRVVRWPAGTPVQETVTASGTRLRQLSRDGRYGVLHVRTDQQDLVDWIDFASGRRTTLGRGSIDNAALHPNGHLMAWTQRGMDIGGQQTDLVEIRRARLDAQGNVLSSLN